MKVTIDITKLFFWIAILFSIFCMIYAFCKGNIVIALADALITGIVVCFYQLYKKETNHE